MRSLRLRRYSLAAVALALPFFASSCSTDSVAGPTDETTLATIAVSASVVGTPVATLVIDVSAPNIPTPLTFNLQVSGGVASGTLKIPPGNQRTIHGRAFDSNGDVTYEGSVTIDVRPGNNPALSLPLVSNAGHVPITVTLGGVTLAINPGTGQVTVGNILSLTATITGPNGQPISGDADWATTDPTVATVDADGNVTGVWEGTAQIVATYAGSAATMTLTVPSCVQTYSFGTSVSGTLANGDCRKRPGSFFNPTGYATGQWMDLYGASVTAQRSLRFNETGPFDTFLINDNSALSLSAYNDDSHGTLQSEFHIIMARGDYLIAASAYALGQGGAYTLSTTDVSEDVANCTHLDWVTPGISTDQQLETTDCATGVTGQVTDTYQIALVQGQIVVVSETSAPGSSHFIPALTVGGQGGTTTTDGAGNSTSTVTFVAPVTATFGIAAGSSAPAFGPYTLTVH